MRMLPALALLLPCTVLAAPGSSATFNLRCEREMKPQFDVSAQQTPFRVRDNVASRVLNTKLINASVNKMALGMTASTSRVEILFDAPSVPDLDGKRECVSPRISVSLGYQPLEVFVAREFHSGSCSYREIYAHEMRHVQLYRDQLLLVRDKVRAELAARYGERPLYAALGQGEAQIQRDVDNWLRPLIKDELARVDVMQAQLDSPEEVFHMSSACGGEIAAILGVH